MIKLTVRNAKIDDAEAIATIHVKTWQCTYKGQIPDSYLDSLSIEQKTEGWRKQIQNAKENEHIFVAETDGNVVGWCTAGASRDEDASKDVGELQGIYIHPDFIGKGIGTKLMEHALNILKKDEYKTITLWVLSSNANTRKFYEKKGWSLDGKEKNDIRGDFELHEVRYSIYLKVDE